MLPNIKMQAAVLKKCLNEQFGLQLQNHQALELVSRMMGFSDYQALLRGVKSVERQIFAEKTVHAVMSARYFNGEDEVCYLLGQMLNLLNRKTFVVEARATLRPDQNVPESEVVDPVHMISQSEGFSQHLWSTGLSGGEDWPSIGKWFTKAKHPIAMSTIFSEVMLLENNNYSPDKNVLHEYIRSEAFDMGLVSTGEGKSWRVLDDISAFTNFKPLYHLAISKAYTSRSSASILELIDSIRKTAPHVPIVAWIFEDNCSTYSEQRNAQRVVFAESPSERNWCLIPGLGFVRDGDAQFFRDVLQKLKECDIPFLRVPHYPGDDCFVGFDITPNKIAERDRITLAVARQMEALGFIK